MQFLPAAKVLPQVLELTAKSPVVAMLEMFSTPVPVLDRVTALAAEVFPITVLANVKDVGDRVTTG